MTIYKRVEIVDGETKEPVQFVALHPFAWPEDYTPTAAFVEDEDATARLTAADALATTAANHIADPQCAHTLLDLVKALRVWKVTRTESDREQATSILAACKKEAGQ